MAAPYFLGIDAGTSKIGAVLFDVNGEEVAGAEARAEAIYNGCVAEQDMRRTWAILAETIRRLIEKSGVFPDEIACVGLAAQGEGCWLLDNSGEPVRNAVLWNDGRAAELVRRIKENRPLYSRIKQVTGSFPFPGATSVILAWLRANEPETLQRAKHCVFAKDWLRYKLTGEVYLETTDSSSSILDLTTGDIAFEILTELGLDDQLDIFPKILKSADIAGHVTCEAARATGLKPGTPVVAGMFDIVATAVGAGAVRKNDTCTILGTTCVNEIVRGSIVDTPDNASGFEYHAVPGLYLNVIAPMAGTPNLDWAVGSLFAHELEAARKDGRSIFEDLEMGLQATRPGASGVIYQPYISSGGERAPFYNPNAKAGFFGISSQTTRFDLLRAVYEGVAFSIKDCLQGAEGSGTVFLSGGGARSRFWAQIIADCTGKEVVVQDASNLTAKGAAIAAGIAVGLYEDFEKAATAMRKEKYRLSPTERNVELYDRLFAVYKELRLRHMELWDMRKEILDGFSRG